MAYRVLITEPTLGLIDRTAYVRLTNGGIRFTLIHKARSSATVLLVVPAGDSYSPTLEAPIFLAITPGGDLTWDDATMTWNDAGFTWRNPPRATLSDLTPTLTWNDATMAWNLALFFWDTPSWGVFAGTIDKIDYAAIGDEGWREYTLTCTSLERYYDSLKISPRFYTGRTAAYIYADLVADAAAKGVPVAAGTIEDDGVVQPDTTYNWESYTEAFDKLASATGMTWGVDPTAKTAYLKTPTASQAPFELQSADIQWETLKYHQERTDTRSTQMIEIDHAQLSPATAMFAGTTPGANSFTLPYLPDLIVSAQRTTGAQASGTITVTSQPAPGDTISVAFGAYSTTYTFVDVIDNAEAFQVLIGASTTETAANLADAINSDPTTAGVKFSLPTLADPLIHVLAADIAANALTARANDIGNQYNGVAFITASSAAITLGAWSGGLVDYAPFDLLPWLNFTRGSTAIDLRETAVPSGYSLLVKYRRLGGNIVIVQNPASSASSYDLSAVYCWVEAGSSIRVSYTQGTAQETFDVAGDGSAHALSIAPLSVDSFRIDPLTVTSYLPRVGVASPLPDPITPTGVEVPANGLQFLPLSRSTAQSKQADSSTTYAAALIEARALLADHSEYSETVEFTTYRPGLVPGMWLTIPATYPLMLPPSINIRPWLVQQVNGSLVPGMPEDVATVSDFLYSVTCASSASVPHYLQLLEQLLLNQQ